MAEGELEILSRWATNEYAAQCSFRKIMRMFLLWVWTHDRENITLGHLWPVSFLVQSLSHVWLFATPWTAAQQASLSFTVSLSLSKLMSIESRCHPTTSSSGPFLLLMHSVSPAPGSFPVSRLFTWGGQSIRASASASVLPMNIQGWFPLGLSGFISLLSKGLSRVFSNTTVSKHQFFGTQPSLWSNSHIHT